MADYKKPNSTQAMLMLIDNIKENILFDIPVTVLCEGVCRGCSKKLLDYLENEIIQWEFHIQQGGKVTFGDLHRLIKTSKKIYKVLQTNGHISQ